MANSITPPFQTGATQITQQVAGGARVFNGSVTLLADIYIARAANDAVAAGSANTDAGPIYPEGDTASLVVVTDADGTKGVIMPLSKAGRQITLFNNSASTLKVYPGVGGKINEGSADAALSLSTKKPVVMTSLGGANWIAAVGA